ncbi:MAG: RNA-binding transcriptional accessory protein, partial [Candidatus Eisenbacteria sp.]|nr:RNA-binding transcriptional accessory protein [Candidatus Eisenbacteria bacterium]
MNAGHITRIADELTLRNGQVHATAVLLEEGATVPFIARYRKEVTGSLDEVAIRRIRDRLEQLAELDKRREAILTSLAERDLLTDKLQAQVLNATTLVALEDIYLPYRPKRRTRATVARERGLEPLAHLLLAQETAPPIQPAVEAQAFINQEKGVATVEEALAGARDIIAEMVSEDTQARSSLRELINTQGTIRSRVGKDKAKDGTKYKHYFKWEEATATAPSHRILAMLRGERERVLTLCVLLPEEDAERLLLERFVKGRTPASEQVTLSVQDGYKRLLFPSMESETKLEMKRRADEEAIRVFALNLRELLLAPPLGEKTVLAIDPGFRTGCKVTCLDRQGKPLHSDAIYPHTPDPRAKKAGAILLDLCKRFQIEAIAIGNGTAGRETEAFVRRLGLPARIPIVMVNECGASIYSASEVAREEFPNLDVTVRGAISIGRRLMDPLAELVKIDPKSIGVGQYQHDVDQKAIKRSLDDIVMSCVNAIGVDVNTASIQLLAYVSGLGPQLARNIVAYRAEHGPFATRMELTKVPRLGPKSFEQAAGFLRIQGGSNPLGASAVHPESYHIVEAMAEELGCSVADLMRDKTLRERVDPARHISDNIGLPTLMDILEELAKPGRDPRDEFEVFSFAEGIGNIHDLNAGMKLPGVVTNVTAFGAFVDIGVHEEGLVHISQLADQFVKDP